MGAVALPFGIVPSPIPAHRYGRAVFPHPALRPASREGMRRVGTFRFPAELEDTEVVEDALSRELPGSARADLVLWKIGVSDAALRKALVARISDRYRTLRSGEECDPDAL
jgi:hypothetical protein